MARWEAGRPMEVTVARWARIGTTALVLTAMWSAPAWADQAEVGIQVLSNRADLVSGGDALVAVTSAVAPRVEVNGRDVSGQFTRRPDGRFVGLVDGLRNGQNVLTARNRWARGGRITITNHPIGGPVFAGPQVQPWVCGTVAAGLGQPIDAQCNAAAVHSFVYRNALTGLFLPYDPNLPPLPALIAQTTTDQGVSVPYIVRIEKGTMDRGIYQLAVLSQPNVWNHKLLVRFEGGAAGHHSQDPPPDVLDHAALSRGFLVATSGLLVHASNDNQVVSAETVLMLKEHVTERYGEIRYTIGTGCSGGSIQQQMIAAQYPGLLDGIQPACSYPDLWTTATEVTDCHLLLNYFTKTGFDPLRRAAIDGHQSALNCVAWEQAFSGLLDPARAANCNLPPNQVYPNPGGVRCAPQDYQKAVWGTRAGAANRPLDNVGVQYGLNAVNAGTITPAEFVDLNASIGGADINWQFTTGRTAADPDVMGIAYRTSQVTDARQLAATPMIDLRPYIETEIHTSFHSYQLRAKLDRDTGGHGNQLIWTFPLVSADNVPEKSFLLMDQWLAAIERDTSPAPRPVKVLRNKPTAAVDTCWIAGNPVTDQTQCRQTYPHYGDARIAAGGPLTDDTLKCRLKPLNRADYRVTFTDSQWTRLQQAFPTGTCDWTKPGVGQKPSVPWLTYAYGPGGWPLGR